MPLYLHEHLEPSGELGLWNIEEEEEWFLHKLLLSPMELRQLSRMKGRRRTEWLAVRQLVHTMSGREKRGAFVKDEFGKPHLENSNYHISISHSETLAAAIAGPVPVGIDIQKIVPKITRIAHKFLREEERAIIAPHNLIEHMHFYWGAKEALYKTYGRRELDFREHIFIEPFHLDAPEGEMRGRVTKGSFSANYQLKYRSLDGFVLVYAWELP
ncbi:MAG: 4'-phosphopantetheinyl transferase superfamily protein [Saprospiraceae bacterium]|nr:4'-phosphopantetheinyl transferase superfamily protein [Saprospiraceae bacterium]